MRKKQIISLLVGIFCFFTLTCITADFGYNYLDNQDSITAGGNFSINVNNSLYWNGFAWDIDRWRLLSNHTFNLPINIPLGLNSAPSLYFGTDTDTGIYSETEYWVESFCSCLVFSMTSDLVLKISATLRTGTVKN